MAIKNLDSRLPEWGKIKIGGLGDERKKQGKDDTYRLPVMYDHFLITTLHKDAAGRFMADKGLMNKFAKEGGPTITDGPYKGLPILKEIPIRLLYDDIDLNFFNCYASYRGKRCWCSGDGEVAKRLTGENGKYQEVTCPCDCLDSLYKGQDKCKPVGTLQCLIQGTDRIGGVWKFRSTSWNTVPNILKSLEFMKTLTGGPLAGIPLWLVLSPKTVTIPGTDMSKVAYVARVEYRAMDPNKRPKFIQVDDEGERMFISAAEQELTEWGFHIARRRIENRIDWAKIETEHKKLLIAPQAESTEEQAETAEEFYPEGFLDDAPGEVTNGAGPDADAFNLDGGVTERKVYTIPPDTKPEPQAESEASITLPALMEFVKNPSETPISLPVALVTKKGVAIGRWLEYSSLNGNIQVTIELVDNLAEVAQGLTVEMIKKSFTEAGVNLVIVQPGQAEKAQEKTSPKIQNGANKALF